MVDYVGYNKPDLLALAHYGVKGMKWGRRKQRQLGEASRVASGQGSLLDKARVAATTPGYKLARKGGLKKAAGEREAALQLQKKRIELGEATIRDKLEKVMTTSLIDVIRDR